MRLQTRVTPLFPNSSCPSLSVFAGGEGGQRSSPINQQKKTNKNKQILFGHKGAAELAINANTFSVTNMKKSFRIQQIHRPQLCPVFSLQVATPALAAAVTR